MRLGHFSVALQRSWQRLNDQLRAHRRTTLAVTLAIGAIPALYIGWFVARYGVEVPLMDDWEMAPLIAKAHTGELTFADFFKQEEEARMIVPKIIFVLSAIDGHWDVRDQMMLSVVVCALTALGIFVLLLRADLTLASTALCFWIISLLIFTPAQFELWLFASGMPSFLPVLFLVAAWLVLQSNASVAVKFGSCAVLAAMSSFTLAHGPLLWALTFPIYLLAHRVPGRKLWLVGWVALSAVCGVCYLAGYSKPAHLPAFAPAIPASEYLRFFLMFVGGAFAYAADEDRSGMALKVGAVALVLFLALAAWTTLRLRDRDNARQALPWLALGFYSLGSGMLAMLGRVGLGAEYAIASRYVTFSLYLFVALVVLGALAARPFAAYGNVARLCAIIAAGLLLGLGGWLFSEAFGRSVRILDSIAARNRLARAALLFSPVLDTSTVLKRIVYPMPERAVERAQQMDRLNLLAPPLVRTNQLESLPNEPVNNRAASGWCDAIVATDEGAYRASGWAALNGKGRPADAVVLAHGGASGKWVLFALSDVVIRRNDIERLFGTKDQLWTGWFATFPAKAVPPGADISVWAVDADGPTLYRLQQNTPTTIP